MGFLDHPITDPKRKSIIKAGVSKVKKNRRQKFKNRRLYGIEIVSNVDKFYKNNQRKMHK